MLLYWGCGLVTCYKTGSNSHPKNLRKYMLCFVGACPVTLAEQVVGAILAGGGSLIGVLSYSFSKPVRVKDNTVLHLIAKTGRECQLGLLLNNIPEEQRASLLTITDPLGCTPFACAAANGNVDFMAAALALIPVSERGRIVAAGASFHVNILHLLVRNDNDPDNAIACLRAIKPYVTSDMFAKVDGMGMTPKEAAQWINQGVLVDALEEAVQRAAPLGASSRCRGNIRV